MNYPQHWHYSDPPTHRLAVLRRWLLALRGPMGHRATVTFTDPSARPSIPVRSQTGRSSPASQPGGSGCGRFPGEAY